MNEISEATRYAPSSASLHAYRPLPCVLRSFAASRARRCLFAPHSLHVYAPPCSQMPEPPHSRMLEPSPRTPCTCIASSRARRCRAALLALAAASRARRCLFPRTPCTCVAASRARRCPSPRTLCTGVAASRARRCPLPRTPCTCIAPSRARRCSSPRTPYTSFAASRARRCLFPGTPCRDTLPGPCRARTLRRSCPPRPRADASRGPGPWRSARSVVTHGSVAGEVERI